MFLVSNYIKAYSSKQVIIPSLYDGEFKKNTAYDLEINKVLRPPVDKKIQKPGCMRQKRHASKGKLRGPARNRTVAVTPSDSLWGLSGAAMAEEPAGGYDSNQDPLETGTIPAALNPESASGSN